MNGAKGEMWAMYHLLYKIRNCKSGIVELWSVVVLFAHVHVLLEGWPINLGEGGNATEFKETISRMLET